MEEHGQDSRPSRRRFRISVAGRLDKRFIDGADEIELGHSTDGSTLDGPLIDQSHVRGILDRLWQLGIEVLRFETYLSDPDDPHTTEHDGTSLPPQTPGGTKNMTRHASTTVYRRRVTAMERLFTRSPFSLVTMVARIKGEVTQEALTVAVEKVQQRHTNLRVRLEDDDRHNPWFTTEGAAAIPIKVVPRESADQWIRVAREMGKIPFEFEKRPAIRFVLVQSEEVSELVVMCHHILGDGLSLAYLVRDLLEHLGDPSREVTVLPDPAPVSPETMPCDLSLNSVVRYVIRRINRKWEADPVYFDQHDYELLTEAYWQTYDHQMEMVELSETETVGLVERCRRERVTVNTALAAAFAGAQSIVLGEKRYEPELAVAADLRGRLRQPVGEVMGFYAGVATHRYEHNPKVGFWDNARKLHAKLQEGLTDKSLFKEPLTWSYLSPSILDAINFKKLGGL
ncbi:MAG: condensation domain-containing protein, partial [Actinomycetota bacterium]|nr:condensation domain-containing protein [Actinomycetota bacterium]